MKLYVDLYDVEVISRIYTPTGRDIDCPGCCSADHPEKRCLFIHLGFQGSNRFPSILGFRARCTILNFSGHDPESNMLSQLRVLDLAIDVSLSVLADIPARPVCRVLFPNIAH